METDMTSTTRFVIHGLLIAFVFIPVIWSQSVPCPSNPRTQSELTACAGQDLAKADAELNQVYRQVLKRYANDRHRVARIVRAEKAWIVFRDSEVDASNPKSRKVQSEVLDMCRAGDRARLTRERVLQLRTLLDHEEGDLCSPM